VIGGVCSGLGDYFNIDKVIIRLIWVFSIIFAGFGLLAYLIAWIAIPSDNSI
ncbi:MAG: PspC domain-containing protein, partial [Bacteroidota bacterium]